MEYKSTTGSNFGKVREQEEAERAKAKEKLRIKQRDAAIKRKQVEDYKRQKQETNDLLVNADFNDDDILAVSQS